uniref:DUF4817 domain-containing protein n=1 Tax=Panagrolaimus davidi TaxID=227884 RepID=A0A914PX16_9BILA
MSSSKLKHQPCGKPNSDNDNQCSNLNLNQNNKCPSLTPVQSHNKSCSPSRSHNFVEEKNPLKESAASDLCPRIFTCLTLNDGVKAESKNRWKKSSSSNTTTESTISLHIAAYENSNEASASDSFYDKQHDGLKNDKLNTFKTCKNTNHLFNAALEFQTPFEFPRQQNDEVAEPEMSHFRASQRLLNRNDNYNKYTPQQKTDCVIWYIETKSPTEVQRLYRAKYGRNEQAPVRQNITRWFTQFQERGSVFRKKRDAQRPIRSEEKIQEVLEFFSAYQHSSGRRAENEIGISRTSIRRILKDEKWHPYKMQLIQELEPDDHILRVAFAEQHLAFLAADPSHLSRIWWSDEAIFHVNGAVNRHNCRYWSPENPSFHGQQPLHSPKVSVWSAISAIGIIGPYFFPGNVSGESYVQMLEEFFIPVIQDRPYFGTMLFQQDGAPAHFALDTRRLLNEVFPGRWIGRASPNLNMPPRSCDLTPEDFFLWGYIKSKVYSVQIRDLEHLKERIIEVFDNLDPAMVRRACLQGVEHRLRKCLAVNGRSVELPDPPRPVPPQQVAPVPQQPPPNRRRAAASGNAAPASKRRRGRPSNPPSSSTNIRMPEAEIEANVASIAHQPNPEPEPEAAVPMPQQVPPQRNFCSVS